MDLRRGEVIMETASEPDPDVPSVLNISGMRNTSLQINRFLIQKDADLQHGILLSGL